jgi:hypothetical protein
MNRSLLPAAIVCLGLAAHAGASVIITGVMDGNSATTHTPKVLELYVHGTEDLSNYTLERSNAGSFSWTIGLSGVYSNEFVYLLGVGPSVAEFQVAFGTTGDFANIALVNGIISGNGNDAFRIVDGSNNVIDQMWTLDNTNVYLDSYMYRVDESGPDGGWVPANWMMFGNDTLDGLTLAQVGALVPFGTYQVPEPASAALLSLAVVAWRRRRLR